MVIILPIFHRGVRWLCALGPRAHIEYFENVFETELLKSAWCKKPLHYSERTYLHNVGHGSVIRPYIANGFATCIILCMLLFYCMRALGWLDRAKKISFAAFQSQFARAWYYRGRLYRDSESDVAESDGTARGGCVVLCYGLDTHESMRSHTTVPMSSFSPPVL